MNTIITEDWMKDNVFSQIEIGMAKRAGLIGLTKRSFEGFPPAKRRKTVYSRIRDIILGDVVITRKSESTKNGITEVKYTTTGDRGNPRPVYTSRSFNEKGYVIIYRWYSENFAQVNIEVVYVYDEQGIVKKLELTEDGKTIACDYDTADTEVSEYDAFIQGVQPPDVHIEHIDDRVIDGNRQIDIAYSGAFNREGDTTDTIIVGGSSHE